MSPTRSRNLPLLVLIGVITLITIIDWQIGLRNWMPVPAEVSAAWESALRGDISGSVIAEFFTLLAAAFLHADFGHLSTNLIFIWIFGAVVLEICGWRWLLFFFVVTTIGASIGQILLDPDSLIPMLGASGALMGFEGVYLGLAVQKKRPDPFIWPMAHPISSGQLAAIGVMSVVLFDLVGLFGPGAGIAYGAHIGGFVTGIFVSFLRRD